jgi:hypothetical protein
VGEIRREIDLTSDNYWRINFEEAEIIEFDYSSKPFDNVEFEIWGARLLVDDFWDHDKSFLPGVPHLDDYYVAGKGKIRIRQVSGIDTTFSPYVKEGNLYKFLYDTAGNIVEKKCKRGEIEKGSPYLWECVLVRPHGFINLNIYACGCVTYEFDDNDMVYEKEFFKNPLKYIYKPEDVKSNSVDS